ncbi:hypothetical protein HY990_02590 [Candidatus Micrarchaeota archaeon]|nr:hypothetical protein [Candidatus Micrarchaeota archaeon]
MKGMIITFDSMIALTFVLIAMLLISSQSYHPRAPGTIYLKQLSLDTITVLDKTGRFNQLLDGNSSGVEQVLEATPNLACMDISLINITGSIVGSVTKSDCNYTSDLDVQVTSGSTKYLGGDYIVRAESWLKKEGG